MAGVEQLLNEAQYAFNSISSGESSDNKRNAARATSLCRKIIRKSPASSEASEAHSLLKRLGEEAYSSNIDIAHRHISQATHHTAPRPSIQNEPSHDAATVPFDWSGLMSIVSSMPRTGATVMLFFGVILFGFFGVFVFLPLIAIVFLTGPFRQIMNQQQRTTMNTFVTRANAYIEERRKSGSGS